jgi:hypothetical protein
MFHQADFELFEQRFQGDPEWNQRRLDVRHRLQAVGEQLKEAYAAEGMGLDRRESLHHPHNTNRKKVVRQRTMLFRDKKARKQLQSFLGKELGKDLDSAMNNLHFQLCIDKDGCWWGLRLDAGAWYDLNVLLKRCEYPDGLAEVTAACALAPGFTLEVNRGGPRPLESMSERDWRDLAGVLRPGESTLEIVARMNKEQVIAAGEDFAEGVVGDLLRLIEFYRLATWTLDSPSGASL